MAAGFYNSNPNLKSIGQAIPFSEEQIAEYIKCKSDPIYFIKTYVKVISLDHGLIPFDLYDYQVEFIRSMHENRMVIGMFPRQHGKCLEKDNKYCIRNKKTGEVLNVTAEQFHEMCRPKDL